MNMDKNIDNRDNVSLLQHREEFETVYGIISAHKKRAMSAMHNESLNMLWEVGAYVSDRLKKAAWGDGVVRMLAEYIHTRSPKAKGWSYRTIYKMVQFYETYSSQGFNEIVHHYGMQYYLSKSDQRGLPNEKKAIVPFEMAQIENDVIVPDISKHLKNIYDTGEQKVEATVSKMEIVQQGNTEIIRKVA